MGKFFEAMQRAAQAQQQGPDEKLESAPPQPELDDSLLVPEGGEADVFGSLEPVGKPDGDRQDSPSAVIRWLESGVRAASLVRAPKTRGRGLARSLEETPANEPQATLRVVANQLEAPDLRARTIPLAREPDPTGVRVHPAYDRIVQRLLTFRRTPRQSAILVASAVAGEGASTVARNLASALSHSGTQQVLLVDANLRTPTQHSSCSVDKGRGLSDVLKGELSLTDVVRADVGLGFSLITCGSKVKSPTQAMSVPAIQGVMMALLSLYDWIIVDGPPVTVYPEIASLGAACGGAVLVVHAERTRSEVAEEAKVILEGTGVEVLGAVLNRRRFHIPAALYKRL